MKLRAAGASEAVPVSQYSPQPASSQMKFKQMAQEQCCRMYCVVFVEEESIKIEITKFSKIGKF